MAIYHLTAKIIGRKAGQSAVACAAYRSGQELGDDRTGQTFRFSRADRVAHSEIVLPAAAPDWARDRAVLWNAVEAGERRKDAQLAREFELALPVELDLEQQRELLRAWIVAEITPAGAAADLAIHLDKAGRNPHAHIMTTMRALGPEGWSKQKLRQWEDRSALQGWRESWASHVNQALERAGRDERVDHRSYAEQDARLPEAERRKPTLKLGLWAARGERAAHNAMVRTKNAAISAARAVRKALASKPSVPARPVAGAFAGRSLAAIAAQARKLPDPSSAAEYQPTEAERAKSDQWWSEHIAWEAAQQKKTAAPGPGRPLSSSADDLDQAGQPLRRQAAPQQPNPSGPSPADLAAQAVEAARKKKEQALEDAAAKAAWEKKSGKGR